VKLVVEALVVGSEGRMGLVSQVQVVVAAEPRMPFSLAKFVPFRNRLP
jgi:hypothetical protein